MENKYRWTRWYVFVLAMLLIEIGLGIWWTNL